MVKENGPNPNVPSTTLPLVRSSNTHKVESVLSPLDLYGKQDVYPHSPTKSR